MRSLQRTGAALVAALSLAGCWLQPGFDARNSRANPYESTLTRANVATLTEAWSVPTSLSGQPLVGPGRVVVGGLVDDVAVLEAYDLATGALAWSRSGHGVVPGFGIAALPTIAGDRAWIGAFPDPAPLFATNFSAFDVAGGAPAGTFQLDGLASRPVVTGDVVVQTTGSPGRLLVRDSATMTDQWSAPLADDLTPTAPTAPVVAGDQIYVSSGLMLQSYPTAGCGAVTCSPSWSLDLGADDPHVTSETVAVVAATPEDDALVTHRFTYTDPYTGHSTDHGYLQAIDPDGQTIWSTSVGSLGSTAVSGDTVFVAGYQMVGPEFEPQVPVRYLRAIEDGTVVWRGASPASGQLAVAGGVLYRSIGATVEAYDAAGCGASACEPIASVTVPGSVRGLSVAAGRLLVSSNDAGVAHLTAFAPT